MVLKSVITKVLTAALCVIFALIACSCNPDGEDGGKLPPDTTKEYIKLSFYGEEGALTESKQITAEKYTNVAVSLDLSFGFVLESVSYSGEYSVLGHTGEVWLILNNVKYDEAIEVNTSRCNSQIDYYTNGGMFIGFESTPLTHMGESGTSAVRERKNTERGIDSMYRAGYTQTGWNTQPSGDGEHIGLGSRVTVAEGQIMPLYAEWAKWTDASMFEYSASGYGGESVKVTRYKGANTDELVIPSEIDGKTVTELGDGFADGKSFKKLVLPAGLTTLGKNEGCRADKLFMYDLIASVNGEGFDSNNIGTCYVNAAHMPTTIGLNSNGVFAESMDRLILNYGTDKKNLIFFGGCSMAYGLNSAMVDEYFDYKFCVTDVGVNADFNQLFQFECIMQYIKDGDVLLHAPEIISEQAMLVDFGYREGCGWMFWSAIEGNYDLLSLVDFSHTEGLFPALAEFNETRSDFPYSPYDKRIATYNEYGDCIEERDGINFFLNGTYSYNQSGLKTYNTDLLERGKQRLNQCYEKVGDKGATVLFSYMPINKEALVDADEYYFLSWRNYDIALKSALNPEYVTIVSSPETYIFDYEYIYDEDYHLNEKGADLRTRYLIPEIEGYLL